MSPWRAALFLCSFSSGRDQQEINPCDLCWISTRLRVS